VTVARIVEVPREPRAARAVRTGCLDDLDGHLVGGHVAAENGAFLRVWLEGEDADAWVPRHRHADEPDIGADVLEGPALRREIPPQQVLEVLRPLTGLEVSARHALISERPEKLACSARDGVCADAEDTTCLVEKLV
jgi:hypothetical protein